MILTEMTKAPEFSKQPKEIPDQNENLWTAILGEVQTKGNNKLPSNKSILVLGDNESGKTTLIAKLQGVEDPKKGSGLEYAYIDVRDEYRDDQTKLSVWVLDGDPGHSQLLRFALQNGDALPNTLVMIVASMATPWAILDQLRHWADVLKEHIKSLKIPYETMVEYRTNLVTKWEEYVGDPATDDLDLKRRSRDEPSIPLSEGVLVNNLGIDIVVVITKTDMMSMLEKEKDFRDEHFDFMLQWIRRFCMELGAGLFYTSAKEDKNCDLLYKYLTHRLYGLPFTTPALVVEKEAILVPSGWDSMKKISIVCENLQGMKASDPYNEVIAAPPTRKSASGREAELAAEDEQVFLARMLANLQQGPSPDRPANAHAVHKTSHDRGGMRAPGSGSSPKKVDVASKVAVTAQGEGVLANFFNSLLHKKPGSSPNTSLTSSPKPPVVELRGVDKAVIRSGAVAELDRMIGGEKGSSDNEPDASSC